MLELFHWCGIVYYVGVEGMDFRESGEARVDTLSNSNCISNLVCYSFNLNVAVHSTIFLCTKRTLELSWIFSGMQLGCEYLITFKHLTASLGSKPAVSPPNNSTTKRNHTINIRVPAQNCLLHANRHYNKFHLGPNAEHPLNPSTLCSAHLFIK